MPRIQLDEVMQGLGLLGNVLSLPRQVQAQQIQNEQTRALLQGSGIPDEMIKAATPEPMMRWLSPQQGGFTGHVLGGVGDVGSILSTIVGKPVKAPRMELSDLAAASKLRSAHAAELAKKRLGEVILDPKSTKRQIAEASVAAGSTDQALRMLRGDGEGRPPASILGLRSAIEGMDPDDPRRPQYQRALDDQLEYERQRREEEDRMLRERQPPHYTPEETQRRRYDEIKRERADEAARRNLKPGTPEHSYFMDHGYERPERQPPSPEEELNKEIDREQRRRDAMAKDPVLRSQIPDEPVETTARRNLAARQRAGAAVKAGEQPPPLPPPKPKRGATAGAAIGAALGGESAETPPSTITPTTGPPPSTTSTTEPPGADTSDAKAQEILDSIEMGSLSPEGQAQAQQLLTALSQGMPKWQAANWALSLPRR